MMPRNQPKKVDLVHLTTLGLGRTSFIDLVNEVRVFSVALKLTIQLNPKQIGLVLNDQRFGELYGGQL